MLVELEEKVTLDRFVYSAMHTIRRSFNGFVKLAEENHIKIPSRPLSSFS